MTARIRGGLALGSIIGETYHHIGHRRAILDHPTGDSKLTRREVVAVAEGEVVGEVVGVLGVPTVAEGGVPVDAQRSVGVAGDGV